MSGRFILYSFAILFLLTGTAWAQVRFEDVTRSAGIDWTHRNGATEEKYLIETMGGGGAFLDFDGDGWLDIFLVDSGSHERSKDSRPGRNALYRNNRDGTFADVTDQAGLRGGFYGNGAAVADFDNDGRPDLYVTGWDQGRLYRNRDGKSFQDVTRTAGVAASGWSTSAAFFDLENDGDLDLFVCRYLDWDFDKDTYCGQRKEGYRSYCHPSKFKPVASLLYRNDGNGSFTDVSAQAGVALPGKALGVVAGDLDGDGLADLHVANDAEANFLFRNEGGGTFSERALESEVAYGMAVKPESGMGTDLGDFDGDGRLDLIVTNIDYEMNNLYANRDDSFFTDVTLSQGNGRSGLLYSGFGVRFLDYDNDGDLDLAIANGHPLDNIHLYRDRVTSDEPAQLLENRNGRYVEAGSKAGEFWQKRQHGRGLATGDYDNDGDIDLLFINNGSPPVLLRNQGGNRNPWWGVQLEGRSSNRDGVGATVTVSTDRRRIVRQRTGGGSYQSSHDPRLHFGLLPDEKIQRVEIRWPSGVRQTLKTPQLLRYQKIREPEA